MSYECLQVMCDGYALCFREMFTKQKNFKFAFRRKDIKVLNNRTFRVKEVRSVNSVLGAPEDVMRSVFIFVSTRT